MAKKLQSCIDALLQLITAKAKFKIAFESLKAVVEQPAALDMNAEKKHRIEITRGLFEAAAAEYNKAMHAFLQTI